MLTGPTASVAKVAFLPPSSLRAFTNSHDKHLYHAYHDCQRPLGLSLLPVLPMSLPPDASIPATARAALDLSPAASLQ